MKKNCASSWLFTKSVLCYVSETWAMYVWNIYIYIYIYIGNLFWEVTYVQPFRLSNAWNTREKINMCLWNKWKSICSKRRRADHSFRGVLPTVVRRCVWSRKPREWGGHDPRWVAAPQKKERICSKYVELFKIGILGKVTPTTYVVTSFLTGISVDIPQSVSWALYLTL